MFLESTHNSKLEKLVLQLAGYTIQVYGTQYVSFGKLEVSDDLLEPGRNLDEKKSDFCGERSSVTLYKQKRKRNSTALQLLGGNSDVATEDDVSESRELNVVQ